MLYGDCAVCHMEKLSWWRDVKHMYRAPDCFIADTHSAALKSAG